eukprot:TRINITY_DN21101_c0_g1_i1.p1 TRINITY_DN21101_c0_g1~~TRINITY_DN21101_c0_g1_i1.p1  ORF type:complete len:156 (-),score=27.69 TRINITY_DN21101_c0_g1_i1:41-508(-)
MGQKLAAACCTNAELDEVTAPDLQGDSFSKPIFFSDDPLPGDRLFSKHSLAKASNAGLKDAVVKEVDMGEHSALICCRPGSRPWRDADAVERLPNVEAVLDGPRYCSTPRASKQSEWNSSSLVAELNRHARSLSLEFRPLQTSIPAPGTPGRWAR